MSEREKNILEAVIKILREELRPRRIFLFGSRAKGTHRKSSDFDFALDCKTPELSVAHRVREKIEGFAGLYRVDLIYLQSISKGFRNIVLSTGKVVYAKGN